MNDTKPKTVFDEREQLRCELAKVKADNISLNVSNKELLAANGRLICDLNSICQPPLLAAMRVCEAVIAANIAARACGRLERLYDGLGFDSAWFQARGILESAEAAAIDALDAAIGEYRALTEPLSSEKRAAVERGLDQVEKVGEMWETN